MAYDHLAEIYDQLMGHVPYDKWVEFTEKIIQKENKTVKSIVDLGCGTGEITIRLAEKGFQLTGVDLSAHMLSHAQQKSTNIKPIRWINQDIRQLNGFKHVDLFTSYI